MSHHSSRHLTHCGDDTDSYTYHLDLPAPKTFQCMMDQILECCEGVIGIADDIVIYGKDDAEHDRRLHNLM